MNPFVVPLYCTYITHIPYFTFKYSVPEKEEQSLGANSALESANFKCTTLHARVRHHLGLGCHVVAAVVFLLNYLMLREILFFVLVLVIVYFIVVVAAVEVAVVDDNIGE